MLFRELFLSRCVDVTHTLRERCLLFVSSLTLGACGLDECPKVGPFEDARFPQLCVGDTLELSPKDGRLVPEVGAPRAADAGAAAGSTLRMVVSGMDEFRHPREAAHVDVTLVKLRDAGSNPLARLTPGGSRGCETRTDEHLHCQLGVNGEAGFVVEYVGENGNGSGNLLIQAKSGATVADPSEIEIEATDSLRLDLRPEHDVLSAFDGMLDAPPSLDCVEEEGALPLPAACTSQFRALPFSARLLDTMEAPESDTGVPAPTLTTGTVTLVSNQPTAFLTSQAVCPPGGIAAPLALRFERGQQRLRFSLCVDRAGGQFEVEGKLDTGGASVPRNVSALPSPVAVVVRHPDAGGAAALEFRTCDGRSLSESDVGLVPGGAVQRGLMGLRLMDEATQKSASCVVREGQP